MGIYTIYNSVEKMLKKFQKNLKKLLTSRFHCGIICKLSARDKRVIVKKLKKVLKNY